MNKKIFVCILVSTILFGGTIGAVAIQHNLITTEKQISISRIYNLFENFHDEDYVVFQAYGQNWIAQELGAESNHPVGFIQLPLKKLVSNPGLVTVSIRDFNGFTERDIVSVSFDGQILSPDGKETYIYFPQEIQFVKFATYYIVVRAPNCPSPGIGWIGDPTGNGYHGGRVWFSHDSGHRWYVDAYIEGDAFFSVFGHLFNPIILT